LKTGNRNQIPVKAKGACPPEDVGGLGGYYSILEAGKDPQHPDHYQYRGMFGAELDPDAFDVDEVNEILHACFGRAA
jgi:hypothetical protein